MWLCKRSWGSVLAVVACVLPMAMGVPSAQAAVQSPFRDVGPMTPHLGDIRWLASAGISTGWPMGDGTSEFRGMDTVKRQDMAAFLRREATRSTVSDAASWKPSTADRTRFRDVRCMAGNPNGANTPHCEDILWLAHAGISTGWKEQDNSFTFRGIDTVKRQDMAAFLRRLADKAGKSGGVTPKTDFTDVTSRTPHVAEVRWLGGSGVSQGYRNANGSWRFEGMTSVYRQDMAAFLHRLDQRLNCTTKVVPVVVQEAYDEQVVDQAAWDETIPAVTKVVHHDAVTHEEPVYETRYTLVKSYPDGFEISVKDFNRLSDIEQFKMEMAHGGHCSIIKKDMPVQTGTHTVVDKAAWDETVVITPEHTVHHEATYKTVHHDAVVKNRTEVSNCRV